ncbi:MAG TPA: IS110 family transposase [Candidatus Sulfotelmatobacter sp.]|nr:IS110 family transposase [Candidatus Sulfotelmatobacter sp.]
MNYVGIDIGKRFHVACILKEEQTASRQVKFNNLREGYEKLISFIQSENGNEKQAVVLGLEATGHYWLTLFQKLKEDGFKVFVLNPLQVQSFRNEKIRGSKTDELDCILIARVLKFGVGNEKGLPDEDLFQLKELTRFRLSLVHYLSSIKLKIIAVLDSVFPEYDTIFKSLFGKTSIALLTAHTTPEEIACLDVTKLTKLLETNSRKYFSKETAEEVQKKAKHTFGLRFGIDAFSLQLKLLLSQVTHLQKQIITVDKEIVSLVSKQNVNLLTIPGISYVTAGVILGETVDFCKKGSSDPRPLLAFAGLEPKMKSSGLYQGKTKMSKRGSSFLRTTILQAALIAVKTDGGFKQIYEKHKSAGKHHGVALSHVAKKLTFVIGSILRTNKPYTPLRS